MVKSSWVAWGTLAMASLLALTACAGDESMISPGGDQSSGPASATPGASDETPLLPLEFEFQEMTYESEFNYRPTTPMIAPDGSSVMFLQRDENGAAENVTILSLEKEDLVTELPVKSDDPNDPVRFSSDGRLAIIRGPSKYEFLLIELSTHYKWSYSAGLDDLTISPDGLWAAGWYPEARESSGDVVRPMRVASTIDSSIKWDLRDFSAVSFGYSQDSKHLVMIGQNLETGKPEAIRQSLLDAGSITRIELGFTPEAYWPNPYAFKAINVAGTMAVVENSDQLFLIDFEAGESRVLALETRSSGNDNSEVIFDSFLGFHPASPTVIFRGYPQQGEALLYEINLYSMETSTFTLPEPMLGVKCGEWGRSYRWSDNCVRLGLLIETEQKFAAEPVATNRVELRALNLKDSSFVRFESPEMFGIGHVTDDVSGDLRYLVTVTRIADLAYFYSQKYVDDLLAESDRFQADCEDGESKIYNCDYWERSLQPRIAKTKFVIERFEITK